MTTTASPFDIICIHCLQNKGSADALCLHCGYDERRYQAHPLYLKPRTLLKNQYRVGRALGQGGFGITYLGLDQFLQKKVAIKEYLPSSLATRDFSTSSIIPLKKQENAFNHGLQLFINEARHLAKFDHPQIVRVINFFEENQTGYMVMDYLAGDSLEQILTQQGGRLPVTDAVATILPILEALTEIHAQHLYHCDISAQNIRILPTGAPILIDFGAARHIVGEQSRTLDLVLKHGYSPLEQYSGKGKIGAWTDIYACGALLYLMVTGILPPAATDRFCEDTLKLPADIPPQISNVIMRALAIKGEDRFQTVQEFKAALEGNETDPLNPITTTPAVNFRPPVSVKKSRRLLWATSVLAGLSLVIFLMLMRENGPPVITSLLKQAETQLANGKWVMPVGDNAYETYQKILQLAPTHAQAQAGLVTVADHFYQLAQQTMAKGNVIDSLAQVKQGLQVAPQHVKLLNLEKELLASLAAQQQAQQQAQQVSQLLDQAASHFAKSELTEAGTVYQQVLKIEANNQQAQDGLRQIVEKYEKLATQPGEELAKRLAWVAKGVAIFPTHQGLLSLQQTLTEQQLAEQRTQEEKLAKQRHLESLLNRAQQQLLALHLTEPAGENAYETYQQVLKLAPNNLEAKQGLVKIANEYERLARIKRDNVQKNLELINKGLEVLPTHAGLLTLRQTLVSPKTSETLTAAETAPFAPAESTGLIVKVPPRPAEQPTPKEVQVAPPISSIPPAVTEETVAKPKDKQIASEKPAATKFDPATAKPAPQATITEEEKWQQELAQAKQQLEKQQLKLAVASYQRVLKEVPHHREASLGLQQVARAYEQLARQELQQQRWAQSLSLIDQGLAIFPKDDALLTLQKEVKRLKQEKPSSLPQPPQDQKPSQNIIFTPSF